MKQKLSFAEINLGNAQLCWMLSPSLYTLVQLFSSILVVAFATIYLDFREEFLIIITYKDAKDDCVN